MVGELLAGHAALERIKGTGDPSQDTLQVAEAGEKWILAVLEAHELDTEEALLVCAMVAAPTLENLRRMIALRRLDPDTALAAAVGAGFFNGLGVALERPRST